MITAKFGGSAVTPANLHFLKRCLSPFHNAVVVSAVGKEHPQDVKATDLLKQFYLTRDERLWNAFCAKYRRLVERNCIDVDVDGLLFGARARAEKYDLAYCMSLGEELSARIVAKYLSADYVEAEQAVRFGSRGLRFNDTVKNLSRVFKGVRLAVTGGFYGGCNNSRKLFSRGGSDVTGALCAVSTGASLYENWTDSYGVCVADPVKVFDVSTVFSLSYDEMYVLARAGAQVLHPDAVTPCARFGIPIKIGNFYNPLGASTTVSSCRSSHAVLSVTELIDEHGNTVTTVLHSLPPAEIAGFFAEFLQSLRGGINVFGKRFPSDRVSVQSLSIRADTATLVTTQSVLSPLYKLFKSRNLIR